MAEPIENTTTTTTEDNTQTQDDGVLTSTKTNDNGGDNLDVKGDGDGDKGKENLDVKKGDGDGEPKGALTGDADKDAGIDWDKITDEEYMKQVTVPDGQQWNEEIMKAYAPLLREEKIDPKVFAKFLAKDAELMKAHNAKADEAEAKEREAARAAFKQAGEDFRKEYTPEQVKSMNEVIRGIDDSTFVTLITKSPLANNKTMGKMLLAYREVYGADGVTKGSGAADAPKGFAEAWTGKKI